MTINFSSFFLLFLGIAQAGQVFLLLPLLRVREVAVGRNVAGLAGIVAVQRREPAAGVQVDVDVRASELDHELQEVPQDQHGILLDEVAARRTIACWRSGEILFQETNCLSQFFF